MVSDARPTLEAIAAGRPTGNTAAHVLAPAQLEPNAEAFRAWAIFADNKGREPLAAPTELLTPLP